ncbi:MAG: hypothetical protein L0Y44_07790 [Phycisphaerales bacterium]|nr:hypothetical protein [Phycisphaerales bacterium]
MNPLNARTELWIAASVFALALTVRLMFLFSSPDRHWPHSVFYEGDAPEWVRYAAALDEGRPYEFDLPLRPPAVAYLIHWLAPGMASQALAGTRASFIAFKVLWCVLSATTCALAYLAFAKQFGRRIALMAASLCVFSFASYVTAASLNNETPYGFILIMIVVGWLGLLERPMTWLAILVGALHGIATLLRPEHTLLLMMMVAYAAWIWLRSSPGVPNHPATASLKRKALMLAMVALTSICVCLPWSVRGSLAVARFNHTSTDSPNYDQAKVVWTPEARAAIDSLPAFARLGNFAFIDALAQANNKQTVTAQDVNDFFTKVFGYVPQPMSRWVLVSIKGPLDFALANHPEARGGFSRAALIRPNEPEPKLLLGRPDHLRLINDGYSVGLGYIKSDPGAWLANVGRKLSNFVDGIALGFTSLNWPIGLEGVRRPIDMIAPEPGDAQFWQFIVLTLIGLGLALAVARRTGGVWIILIGYKVVITILFYGYARQAVSIAPAFYLFAAIALDQIGRWGFYALKPWRRLRLGAGCVLIGGLLAIEIAAFIWRPQLEVSPPQRPDPRWGSSAFESVDTVHIRRHAGRPARPDG